MLRTTSSTVELVVCRLPGETSGSTPPGAPPPPPPTRRDNPGLTLKIPLNPLPPLDVEPCGVSGLAAWCESLCLPLAGSFFFFFFLAEGWSETRFISSTRKISWALSLCNIERFIANGGR